MVMITTKRSTLLVKLFTTGVSGIEASCNDDDTVKNTKNYTSIHNMRDTFVLGQ